MASVYTRKDSPYFWISTRDAIGNWKDSSTKIRLDAPGGRHRAETKAHLESSREADLRAIPKSKLLQAWALSFLQRRYQVRQPRTYERYAEAWTAVNLFLKEHGAVAASQVTRHLVKQYPFWRIRPHEVIRKASWNTALFELKVLGCILQDAVEREELAGNPCHRLGFKRERAKEKNPITREDQATIEAELAKPEVPEWMRVSWQIAMRQGCRISETSVPLDRVDLSGDPPTITFQTKGNRLHTAPLHPDLLPLMERLKESKAAVTCLLPVNASRIWRRFLHGRAGLKQYSFHCTRVTVVTRLGAANFSQPMVKDYVGHASTTVNDVYRKLRARDLVGLAAPLSAAAAVPAETADSP